MGLVFTLIIGFLQHYDSLSSASCEFYFAIRVFYPSVQLPYHGMMASSVGTHKEEQSASALKRLDLAVEAHGR